MNLSHLKPADYVISTWSGGTTTQVAIAPEGAVYADRDFIYRVSSATVDLEVSDFTALPDYNRLISTLQGEIDVTHNDGEAIHLAPYHVHAFDGGWNTRSVGKCRDFNLMMRKDVCGGRMAAVTVSADAPAVVTMEDTAKGYAHVDAYLYCGEGEAVVEAEGKSVTLLAGESAMGKDAAGASLRVSTNSAAKLMLVQAWY